MRLGVISIGCDTATVDFEALIARFVGHGAEVTSALDDADDETHRRSRSWVTPRAAPRC